MTAPASNTVAPKQQQQQQQQQKRGTSAIWVAKSELSKLENNTTKLVPDVPQAATAAATVVDAKKDEATTATAATATKATTTKQEDRKVAGTTTKAHLVNKVDDKQRRAATTVDQRRSATKQPGKVDRQAEADQQENSSSSAPGQPVPQGLLSRQISLSKLNAEAPVFVPKVSSSLPNSLGNLHGQPGVIPIQQGDNGGAADVEPSSWQKPVALSEELRAQIVKQVEFYFSDGNLSTDAYLLKTMKKDPDGFVPIAIIGSFRRMKQLTKNHSLIAAALRTSSKLLVSEDGKKVRRAEAFEDSDLDDLQARTIVAENLPPDRSIQNLEKLFGTVGTVKAVRVCEPEIENGANPNLKHKGVDRYVSNKLHAVVEYETVEQAEKAVSELTDQRDWRSGLHVRRLIRRIYPVSKQHSKARRSSGDAQEDEDEGAAESEVPAETTSEEVSGDAEREGGAGAKRGGRGGGRGRGRGRGRGLLVQGTSPQPNALSSSVSEAVIGGSKPPPGPRMPDGTRGFSFGRGRDRDQAPLAAATAAVSALS